MQECSVDKCSDWSSWADWSECYIVPTLFPNVNCNDPKYRLRERRRCEEARTFCVKTEQEICSCLEPAGKDSLNETTTSIPNGIYNRQAASMSTATVIAFVCIGILVVVVIGLVVTLFRFQQSVQDS